MGKGGSATMHLLCVCVVSAASAAARRLRRSDHALERRGRTTAGNALSRSHSGVADDCGSLAGGT
jgi:hypothetical protein